MLNNTTTNSILRLIRTRIDEIEKRIIEKFSRALYVDIEILKF